MNFNRLGATWPFVAAVAAITLAVATPASAHRNEVHEAPEVQQGQGEAARNISAADLTIGGDRPMAGMEMKDRAQMSFGERLIDWLGRLHPVLVHFPIAFFPAALFTAIVGRRRPAFSKPVQFLVAAGGITAPIAMIVGWFNGGLTLSDTDPLLQTHRWLGTGIGLGGLGLGIWALRQPEEDRGTGMIVGLAILTIAIVVQGWFGAALVHGMDHMNW